MISSCPIRLGDLSSKSSKEVWGCILCANTESNIKMVPAIARENTRHPTVSTASVPKKFGSTEGNGVSATGAALVD